MEIKILGPLEAVVNGVSIVPTASKPRQVFVMLALHAGQVVSVDALMDELWGDELPRSAATTLQTYVLQLRRRLEDALRTDPSRGAKDILRSRRNGYLLDATPQDIDVYAYERLVAEGRRAFDTGDPETASRLLSEALGVWRGPALNDVANGRRLAVEVVRLEENRLIVLEGRIEADLALGRHYSVLGELAVLTAQHPWHENLHAFYMIALYRAGRQWRALDVYQQLRETLVREFGLQPSRWLQQVQQAILKADPLLEEAGQGRVTALQG